MIHREFSVGPSKRKLFLLDNVVERAALKKVFDHFRSMSYFQDIIDRDDTAHVSHMVHYFDMRQPDPDLIVQFYEGLARQFMESMGLKIGSTIRGYANFIPFGDLQFTHTDGDQWTLLAYLNDEWKDDWGGETVFYDEHESQPVGVAIAPKPGRLVIFDGLIPHRGGAPSKLCFLPRIALNLRFAK